MTIHTRPPEVETFVRVEVDSIAHQSVAYHGCVGKVVAEGDWGDSSQVVVLVDMVGDKETKVFNERDLTVITRKEYFQEALKHG